MSSALRWIAMLAAVAAAGCEKILDLSTPGDLEEAVAHTCGCNALDNQGDVFTARCDAAVLELTSDTEQSKAQLLGIGDLNCGSCTEVKPCYAAITDAAPAGGDCTQSDECATWACHAGKLEVVLELGSEEPGPEIGVIDDEPSVCAEGTCVACGPAAAAIVSGVPAGERPVACGEARALAEALLDCIWTKRVGLCTAECDDVMPATFLPCLECLYLDPTSQGRCSDEHAACDADVARPREGGQ